MFRFSKTFNLLCEQAQKFAVQYTLPFICLNSSSDGWDMDVISYLGSKTRGMAGLLLSFEYSVGYLSVASAKEASIQNALIRNSHNHVS